MLIIFGGLTISTLLLPDIYAYDESNIYLDQRDEIINAELNKAQKKKQLQNLQKEYFVREFDHLNHNMDTTKAMMSRNPHSLERETIEKSLPSQTTTTKTLRHKNGYIQVGLAHRVDDYQWTIAGTTAGTSPNILSDLEWNNLKSSQIRAKAGATLFNRFIVEGYGAYADIYSGENQDSDFLGDNRTLEFSRSNNNSKDGELVDLSAGIGYLFDIKYMLEYLQADTLTLTTLAGYSYHELKLNTTEGFQTIPASGPFAGLRSTYNATWEGPWAGFELRGQRNKISGFFRLEYHWADYYAHADWNLRSEFQHPISFEHFSDGMGLVYQTGVSYHPNEHWSVDLSGDIQNWRAREGVDRTHFVSSADIDTQLNEVRWNSYAVMLGATYSFL